MPICLRLNNSEANNLVLNSSESNSLVSKDLKMFGALQAPHRSEMYYSIAVAETRFDVATGRDNLPAAGR